MSVHIPADLRRQIRAHFAKCCAYCHTAEALTVVTFEVEHIIPLAAGGETAPQNLCLACPTWN
jgi:5-methylcytosine-specific restriction endonuclease McrA